jgi:hypothetical protein
MVQGIKGLVGGLKVPILDCSKKALPSKVLKTIENCTNAGT